MGPRHRKWAGCQVLAELVRSGQCLHPPVMVGDSKTDLDAAPSSAAFIGYGAAGPPQIASLCHVFVRDLVERIFGSYEFLSSFLSP